MPRSGDNYDYPAGTLGISGQTIFSARYNAWVEDIKATLNLPLPISKGGTGASNISGTGGARDNLNVPAIEQKITNWALMEVSGLPAEQGFVWSDTTTGIGAPVDGHPFAGTYYWGDVPTPPAGPQNAVVVLQDLHSSAALGITYIKEKKGGGAWSAWQVQGSGQFVLKSGDTMSGNLLLNGGLVRTNVTDGLQVYVSSSGYARTYYDVATVRAWACGGYPSGEFAISDQTAGQVRLIITPTGDVIANNGNMTSKAVAGNNAHYWLQDETGSNKGILYWNRSTSRLEFALIGSPVPITMDSLSKVNLAAGFFGRQGTSGAYGGSVINFFFNGSLQSWVDTSNLGNVTITSDYRIKKDVADLPGMWDTVKALRPIKYTHAQYTPQIEIARKAKEAIAVREQAIKDGVEPKPAEEIQPMFPADDIERWGFIAHELQETLIESAATGVKDDPVHVQSPNPFALIAALTKALQEAMARIEALEASAQQR